MQKCALLNWCHLWPLTKCPEVVQRAGENSATFAIDNQTAHLLAEHRTAAATGRFENTPRPACLGRRIKDENVPRGAALTRQLGAHAQLVHVQAAKARRFHVQLAQLGAGYKYSEFAEAKATRPRGHAGVA